MRRWSLGFAVALVVAGSVPCVAQQPSGPSTLEALLADETRQTATATEADANAGVPSRPAGTVSRPKDGVQHPDLDKAWADYEAAVAKATEAIRAAISKQFDAATAKGDLDAAEKWQMIGEKFEKAGELPPGSEMRAAVTAAATDYKKAREEIAKAYDSVVKTMTMEKKIAEAKALRDEREDSVMRALGKDKGKKDPVLTPYGRWVDPSDPLAKVIEPNGRFAEVKRATGKTHASGSWRQVGENKYEAVLANGWTIWFRVVDIGRMEFQQRTPEGRVTDPYLREKERHAD
jgi:hypothetical protein